jgi:hypothetical protein
MAALNTEIRLKGTDEFRRAATDAQHDFSTRKNAKRSAELITDALNVSWKIM